MNWNSPILKLIILFKNLYRLLKKTINKKKLPFNGFPPLLIGGMVNDLSNDDLMYLNEVINWNAFTTDNQGRRFGSVAWSGKRSSEQEIPDPRILIMNEKFNLKDRSILEIGCFEGIHTIGLQLFSASVKAIDSRLEHVLKTIIRCAFYNLRPVVFQFDVEGAAADYSKLNADFVHHVGVLYHLEDPVSHLIKLGKVINNGIMIDTHISSDHEGTAEYFVGGETYSYKKYIEYGKKEVFSGMNDHSKWLTKDSLIKALKVSGFLKIEINQLRHERNGLRILIFAEK